MVSLTKREQEILEKLLVADTKTVAADLGIRPGTVYAVKARVKGKIEQAREFLREIKKYRRVLGNIEEKPW